MTKHKANKPKHYAQVQEEIPWEETPIMKKQAYIINGSGGVGKDTFIDFVEECIGRERVHRFPPYTELTRYLMGRRILSTERFTELVSSIFELLAEYEYECFSKEPGETVMFMEIADPEQIDRAVTKFNAKTILVTNRNVAPIHLNEANEYDIYIDNSGTLGDLREAARGFCIDQGLI